MNRHLLALLIVMAAVLATLLPVSATPVAAQDQRCFPETGQCISGAIRQYWERNGGLAVFGFPISGQFQATVEGRSLQIQWFERDRLEIQPNGKVTAGRLGVEFLELLQGERWSNGSIYTPDRGCIVTNPATGHQICGSFARYWQANGGLERFGLPITGERVEIINGQSLTVQYFERRRFELHPGGQVLLGLLGREVCSRVSQCGPGQATPAPQPTDPCASVPSARSAAVEPACAPLGTVFVAAGTGFIPGERVGAYITAPTQVVFGSNYQFTADSTGTAGFVTLDSAVLPNDPVIDGIWAVTFEGVTSGHRAIAYFRVLR